MTISIDDRQLVESYQAGDSEAFAELVRMHSPSLLGHAIRRLNDRAAAEDAVQETFVRAYRALPRFDGDYRVGPWLHRILGNVCADEGNRRRRESEKFDRFATDPFSVDMAPGVEDELGLEFDDTDLSAALASLPPSYREALSLRFVEELPYDEVARATGVTEQNARARVSRARTAARSALRGVAAIPALFLPALRKSERVAAAAEHHEAYRAGSTMATSAGQAAPVIGPATDAVMAAAPAATPLFAKALVGISIVAAMATPTVSSDLHDAGRVVGAVDSAAVADPAPAEVVAEQPVDSAPVVAQSGATPVAPVADVVDGIEAEPAPPGPEVVVDVDAPPAARPAPVMPLPAVPPSAGEPEPAAPATTVPAPITRFGGDLSVAALTLTAAGPNRFDVAGNVTLTVDGNTFAGKVSGASRLAFNDDARTGTRRISGPLFVTLENGSVIEIRLQVQAKVSNSQADTPLDEASLFDLAGAFRAVSGDDVALVDSGSLSGSLDADGAKLTLKLAS